MEPLISSDEGQSTLSPANEKPTPKSYTPNFVNYNENEEASCISELTYLSESCLKCYILVPLCSFLTLYILPIKLYWSVPSRAKWMYTQVAALDQATHLLVRGKDGNTQIVKLQNLTENVRKIDVNLMASKFKSNPFIVSCFLSVNFAAL